MVDHNAAIISDAIRECDVALADEFDKIPKEFRAKWKVETIPNGLCSSAMIRLRSIRHLLNQITIVTAPQSPSNHEVDDWGYPRRYQ